MLSASGIVLIGYELFPRIDHDMFVRESLCAIRPNVFAKGGDRYAGEIPEADVFRELGIEIVDGLGAKIQSSSYLNERCKALEVQ